MNVTPVIKKLKSRKDVQDLFLDIIIEFSMRSDALHVYQF